MPRTSSTARALPAGLALVALLVAGENPEHSRVLEPADVQETGAPGGESPLEGESVMLQGVVTGVSPHGRFYYLADPGGGPWSGIKIVGPALDRFVGEVVLCTGRVQEFWGETRLREDWSRSYGEGLLPEPEEIVVQDLLFDPEPWEGVLVRIRDVTVVGETSRFGEYPISDPTGTGQLVDDEFFTSYIADPGDTFESVTGIVAYGFGDFQIEPRTDDDLSGWTSVRNFDSSIRFVVRDGEGTPVPAKATFFPVASRALELGPEDRAEGSYDVAYLEPGQNVVPVPSGTYDVVVSRGTEYGLYEERITTHAGLTTDVEAVLSREVDSSGWISGDFHLHCAPSSDTPLPVPGRILSLAGEGVEWAIATDHDMVTDYGPVIESLGLSSWIRSSVGDEITTGSPSFGHFNAWPLEPGSEPIPDSGQTPESIFTNVRADPGVEVIQVNHPIVDDWGNQYFQIYDVSPYTGLPGQSGFSFDFDALEVFNGRFLEQGLENLDIWMRMLNQGHRITATGNSDSHHLVYAEPGYPRNYVAIRSSHPAAATEDELVRSVREGRVFVSYGPILDLAVNGVGPGETVPAADGRVRLDLRVQCPSWLRVERAKVYCNAVLVAESDIPVPAEGPQDVRLGWTHAPPADAWFLVLVEGDETLHPVRRGGDFRPLAFTNPVRVDLEGDGEWVPPGNFAEAVTVLEIDEVDAQGTPLLLGDWVAVQGCATTDTGFLDPSAGIFYVDDGTGGVQVRETVNSVTPVQRGDLVEVGGFVGQSLGETLLLDVQVDVISPAPDCPDPIAVTAAQVTSGGEPLEGRVVELASLDVVAGSWPQGTGGGSLTVDDGTGPIVLVIPPGVDVPPEAQNLADFEITAIVTQRDLTPPYTAGYRLALRDGQDLFPEAVTSVPVESSPVVLGAPRPNPFRNRIGVPILGPRRGAETRVEVLDVRGRRVARLSETGPDSREIVWDGRDSTGKAVSSGVYYLRLHDETGSRTVRVVKLR